MIKKYKAQLLKEGNSKQDVRTKIRKNKKSHSKKKHA